MSFPLDTRLVPGPAGPDSAGCPLWWHWCPLGAAHRSDGQNPVKRTRNSVNEKYVYYLTAVGPLTLYPHTVTKKMK